MSESKDAKKIKTIAFRLTDGEYARAESAAIAAGDETPNNWCRALVLAKANAGEGMTENQRLIYEEIARVRYLVGHGFRVLFGPDPITAATWKKITADADQSSEIIAADYSPEGSNADCEYNPAASQRAVDCQLTLLRNTYRVGFHNRLVLQ